MTHVTGFISQKTNGISMSVPVAFRLNSAMKVARVAIPAVALTVGIMGGPALWAQGVRVPELKFEVASVKPSTFQAAAFVAPGRTR